MKKLLTILLILMITLGSFSSLAETQIMTDNAAGAANGNPPVKPDGQSPGGSPPSGSAPGGSAPGGQSSQPDSYTAVATYAQDTTLNGGTYTSAGTDENVIVVTAGTTTIDNATILRSSTDS